MITQSPTKTMLSLPYKLRSLLQSLMIQKKIIEIFTTIAQ